MVLAALPPEWPDDPLSKLQTMVRASGVKVVVLDDDPTGTQTVHDVPVLTEWTAHALRAELANDLPAVYLLTNSRRYSLAQARAINTEIGHHLVEARETIGRRPVVVSRGDSMLRGHFPGEVEALSEALGGDFDATLLIPFFQEGGRYTINDIHYNVDGEWLIPVGETEFARDATFGYRASNLRHWVEEKTSGRIAAAEVGSIALEDIRCGGPQRVTQRLLSLPHGSVCAVNAASSRDLAVFICGLLAAEAQGRRYLYRTAASFVPMRAGIVPRPLLSAPELHLGGSGGGLIVVGSHVPLTSRQLGALLDRSGVNGVEVTVEALLSDARQAEEIARAALAMNEGLRRNEDVVLYTGRQLVLGHDAEDNLAVASHVSASLVAVVRALEQRPRYILAKGGITSSDIATAGLGIRRALVLGQILPGVSVWQLGPESRYAGLSYIIFPGNVGAREALADVVTALKSKEE
jgi:uncharacterized protein YgbK (DUF1537 family)